MNTTNNDANSANGVTPNTENSTKKTATISKKDSEFGDLAKKVSDAWNNNSWLALLWTTSPEFEANTALYNQSLYEKQSAKGKHSKENLELNKLDKTVDSGASYVKKYIAEKYGKKNAKNFYAEFGFEQKKSAYVIPRNQESRLMALKLMVSGLGSQEFSEKEYGLTYWQDLKNQYEAALNAISEVKAINTNKTSDKNQAKKELKTTMNSLINAIKANFPEKYSNVLDEWGFQKEKY